MLSDDVYKTKFRATVTALEQWLATLKPVAEIEIAADEASWRVSVVPRVPEACPFELALRNDQQFDIAVGPEAYEDRPVETLDTFLPLLQAIAAGLVVTRVWQTAATATLAKVETIVTPAGGDSVPWPWRQQRTALAGRWSEDDLIVTDRRYAPYARGA